MSSSSAIMSLLINLAAALLFVSFAIKHSSTLGKVYNNLAPYAVPCFFFAGFRECHISIAKTFSLVTTMLSQSNDLVLFGKASILVLGCLILCWPVFRRLQHQFRPPILDIVNISETVVKPVDEKSPVAQPIPPPATSTEEIVKEMPPAPVYRPARASKLTVTRRRNQTERTSRYQGFQTWRSESSGSDDEETKNEVVTIPTPSRQHTKLRSWYLRKDIEKYNTARRLQLELEQRSSPTDQLAVDAKSSQIEAGDASQTILDADFTVEKPHSQEPTTKVDQPYDTVSKESVADILPAAQATSVEFEAGSNDVAEDAAPVATAEDIPAAASSSQLSSTQLEDVSQVAEEQDITSSIIPHLVEATSARTEAEIDTPATEPFRKSSSESAKSVRFTDPLVNETSEVEATIEQQAPLSPPVKHSEPIVQPQPPNEPIDESPSFNAEPANAVAIEVAAETTAEQQPLQAFDNDSISNPVDLPQSQAPQELELPTSISGEQSVIALLPNRCEIERQLSPVQQDQSVTALPDLMDVDHYTPFNNDRVEQLSMEMDVVQDGPRSNYITSQTHLAEPTPYHDSLVAGQHDRDVEMTGYVQEDSVMNESGDVFESYPAAAAIADEVYGFEPMDLDEFEQAMEAAFASDEAATSQPGEAPQPAEAIQPSIPGHAEHNEEIRWYQNGVAMTKDQLDEMLAAPLPPDNETDLEFMDVQPGEGATENAGTGLATSVNGPDVGGPQALPSEMDLEVAVDPTTENGLPRVFVTKRKLPASFAVDVCQGQAKSKATIKKVATNSALTPRGPSKKIPEARLMPVPNGEDPFDYPDDKRRPLFAVSNAEQAKLLIVKWLKLNLDTLRAIIASSDRSQFMREMEQMIIRLEQIKEIIFLGSRTPAWQGKVSYMHWRDVQLVKLVDVEYRENHLRQFIDEIMLLGMDEFPVAKTAQQLAQKLVGPLLPSMKQAKAPAKSTLRNNSINAKPALKSIGVAAPKRYAPPKHAAK